jgi:MoxR-like ATPase
MDNQQSAVAALAVAVAARVPALLWGAPGTGKTSVVRSLADGAGWPCETVIASIREPADFAGLPVVSGAAEAVAVEFAPPRWARRLALAETGLLFFDEISTAPPAVQAALLRVVLERTVGDLTLPDGIAIVAAANPPEQAADGWDLSAPLANRFCHLDWPADARRMAEGFTSGWGTPAVPDLPDDWELAVPIARSWVAGFVSVRPPLAVAVPSDAATSGRAWPSPRSWDMAARLLAAAQAAGADELVVSLLVRGAVGAGAGVEFLTWLEEADLPDPEAVLADPDSFHLPERGDRAFAALTSIAAAVASNATAERWAAAWKVFGRAGEQAPDAAATAARTLARCRPPGAPVPPEVAAFAPLLREAQLLA